MNKREPLPAPVLHDVDPPAPPAELLARHGARVLDPLTDLQLPGQPPPRPTIYVADSLLVQTGVEDELRDTNLTAAADWLGLKFDPAPVRESSGQDAAPVSPVRRMILSPKDGLTEPQRPPDAWAVLQKARSLSPGRQIPGVGLDHLMQACTGPQFHLEPYHGVVGKALGPSADYGLPGRGGRTPVTWVGPAPRRGPVTTRRPRVVILDTGTGAHPWFDDADHAGCLVRVPNKIAGSESSGVFEDPLEGVLDPDAGHGTFIAGIIRQTCPDADIVSIEVMGGDGIVEEGLLIQSLDSVLNTHVRAQHGGGERAGIVDVVSLSLGYYHEHPADRDFDSLLWPVLDALGRAGVLVVASAGNDATTRPLYPAAFTPYPDGVVTECALDSLPVVSVSALNPAGSTALFSNAGAWVNAHQYGAAIVSTMPQLDGGEQAGYQVELAGDIRATIDPDAFQGGFATWSGTSFAAPVLAGKLAQYLLDTKTLDDVSVSGAVKRGRAAVNKLTELKLALTDAPVA